ncbi:hypothetical protein GCM10010402_57260 [Actinomadura luteofluorescens]|uniref:hypothetical protein n=1 Tax=Actinomadura luteofluorescens TaxID=46163 RepID=UPI002164C3AE|nr:hypothetical protein [Actinomadura glauciflava]MCR3741467.1 hypothetical protein [Actinomadura glauciflava]
MPSANHELPIALFRDQPALAPEILQAVSGIKPPEYEHISLGSECFNDDNPTEYRADSTVLLGDPKRPELAIIVENQLRPDRRKRFSWPVYLSTLRARRECPVTLLALCPNETTSAWCREPIEMGHEGWVLRPWVLNLAEAPAVIDVDKARALPELAILGTPAHADGPHRKAVLTAFAEALEVTDRDRGERYHDYVRSQLSEAARHCLEEIMQADVYEWQSDFARKHIAEGEARGRAEGEAKGKAEGEAELLLIVLEGHGFTVDDELRRRITACTDLQQIQIWARRVGTARTLDEIFA